MEGSNSKEDESTKEEAMLDVGSDEKTEEEGIDSSNTGGSVSGNKGREPKVEGTQDGRCRSLLELEASLSQTISLASQDEAGGEKKKAATNGQFNIAALGKREPEEGEESESEEEESRTRDEAALEAQEMPVRSISFPTANTGAPGGGGEEEREEELDLMKVVEARATRGAAEPPSTNERTLENLESKILAHSCEPETKGERTLEQFEVKILAHSCEPETKGKAAEGTCSTGVGTAGADMSGKEECNSRHLIPGATTAATATATRPSEGSHPGAYAVGGAAAGLAAHDGGSEVRMDDGRDDDSHVSTPSVLPPEAPPVLESNFSEAIPLSDEPMDLETAEEVDPEVLQRRARKEEREKKCQRRVFAGTAIFLVLFVLTLVILFSLREKGNNKPFHSTAVPSPYPSTALSSSPSLAPSSSLDNLLDVLPHSSLESLNNFSSPQSQAYDWLMNHPNVTHLDHWRKEQLFALATFFYHFDNAEWKDHIRLDWLDVTKHECNWFTSQQGHYDGNGSFVYTECPPNVTSCTGKGGQTGGILPCDHHGGFASLILSAALKRGSSTTKNLPWELRLLHGLHRLGLNNNRINSSLADFGIQHMVQLEGFQLQMNQFTGTIPPEVGQLENLKKGRLSFNQLTGPIPSQLGLMSQLEFFDGASNQLSGTIPREVWNMQSLKSLYLFKNQLSGHMSSEIALLADTILRLNFNGNRLSGSVPSEIGLLTGLVLLDFGNNELNGTLPSEVGLLTNLTSINLSSNHLSGTLPSELGLLTKLTDMDLSSGNFVGPIPTELGLLQNLNDLFLGNNSFVGEIPSEFALLINLEAVDFERPSGKTLVIP